MDAMTKLLDVAGGGWASAVVLVFLAIFMIWIGVKEKDARDARAQQETDAARKKDQAETVGENQTAESNLNDAQSEIDDVRKVIGSTSKEKRPRGSA